MSDKTTFSAATCSQQSDTHELKSDFTFILIKNRNLKNVHQLENINCLKYPIKTLIILLFNPLPS